MPSINRMGKRGTPRRKQPKTKMPKRTPRTPSTEASVRARSIGEPRAKDPLRLKRMERAKGGSMKNKDNPEDRFGKYRRSSAKKSFPDLTGDGKVTRADILKGRGVFKEGGSTVDSSIDRLSKQYSKKTGVSEKEARDLFRKRYQQTAPRPLRKESQAPKAPKPMGKPSPKRPRRSMPNRPMPRPKGRLR